MSDIMAQPRSPSPAKTGILRRAKPGQRIWKGGLWIRLGLLFGLGLGMQGCARVLQRERDFLSDPIMQRLPDTMEKRLESHNLPRREGSAGGSSGSGGGCGC